MLNIFGHLGMSTYANQVDELHDMPGRGFLAGACGGRTCPFCQSKWQVHKKNTTVSTVPPTGSFIAAIFVMDSKGLKGSWTLRRSEESVGRQLSCSNPARSIRRTTAAASQLLYQLSALRLITRTDSDVSHAPKYIYILVHVNSSRAQI